MKGSVILEDWIELYFNLTKASQRVRERFGDAVIDIPGHETILRPKETLQKLCDHLGVTCTEDYIEKCSKILYGAPSVTRNNSLGLHFYSLRCFQKGIKGTRGFPSPPILSHCSLSLNPTVSC